jgi:nicotinate-nucleotide--dimethylbenzimidazole phosphoribosyltransferase
MLFHDAQASIGQLHRRSMEMAGEKLESLAKPPGSLGVLEEIAIKLAGIYGGMPFTGRKIVMIMAGDHGVVEEGVSVFPQEATVQMIHAFLGGGAAINVLAGHSGAEVIVVDMGVKGELESHKNLYKCKVKPGTNNMVRKPAMTREEAVQAVETGIKVINWEIEKGAKIVALGEMGIGNTTPSSAIVSVMAGVAVDKVVGKGTGISRNTLQQKCQIIKNAIKLHSPNPEDPIDVLSKVGGLEIAGLTGVILGAAARRIPVVIDGFVTGAAAMLAVGLKSECKDYMFPSHLSWEPGHEIMMEWLGLKPMIHMKMRLGEGTGAAMALHIIDAAVKIFNGMSTLEEVNINGN